MELDPSGCHCHGAAALAPLLWGMGWGLCHGPAAAPSSELREPQCDTAENPGTLLGKCCSCFLQDLDQDRMAPEVSLPWLFQDGLWCEQSWGLLCAEDEERVLSHGAVPASVEQSHCSLLGLGPPAGDSGHFESIQLLALLPVLHVSPSLGPQLCAPEIFPLLPFVQGLSCRQSSFQDSTWIPDRCVKGSFAADAGLALNL